MALIRVELFGNLRITCGEDLITSVNTSRLQSLLGYLVLHSDTPVSREQLAFVLWPDSTETQARTNLRQLLHHLRRALPAQCCMLVSDHQTVQWKQDANCRIDTAEFDDAMARGAYEEAIRLYQDDLLRGLYDEWLHAKREHYRQQFAEALSCAARACEEARDLTAAIRHAERLVAHAPLNESHYQTLIRLHAAHRDRASALRAYHQCMRVLRRELGVEPGAATRELFERVLKSEPAAAAQAELPLPPTSAASPLPLVGRHREWSRLTDSWRAAAGGSMRFAVLLGEPGIGKSRLAEELYEWCGRGGHAVARTRCYAGQGQVAYAPIADWLRTEPLRTARHHLSASQLQELARVLPDILEDLPAMQRLQPLAETRERIHFYESLNAAFGKTPKPLLLLIDDLQWCDPDSFEWLNSFFRPGDATQILVLGTARPEETGRDHPLTRLLSELRQSGQVTEISLAPLDAEETSVLAGQVADRALAANDLGELYRATRGNPLFVVESVRAGLREATPPKIHAVISSRLAQLSKPAYELAGMAGAVGRAFSFDLLAKATDWDEDSLSRALDELWQRRIIEGHGAAEYDFTHDRLREVAYGELSLVRSRFLHRRLARALLETQTGDAEGRSAQVATHYEAAGMAEEAIEQYRQAAAVARQRYADEEAAGLLRRAIALCREFPETARRRDQELELLATLGPSLVTTQGYAMPEVGETYERALTLARQSGSKHIFPVLSGAWVFHAVRGQLQKSRELGQEFLDLAMREEEASLRGAGHFLLASSTFHLGEFETSRCHVEESLCAYGGSSKSMLALFAGPDIGVFCRCYLGHVWWMLGQPDRAAGSMAEAIAAARDVGHPFGMAIALDYAAMLHVFARESNAALERANEAVALCRTYDFAYYLAIAEILAGWAQTMQGEGEPGLAQLRQGLDRLRATGAEIRLPFYHGLLAEACAATGRTGEALANVSNAFAYQNKNGEMWAEAYLRAVHERIAHVV
jgi:DNA-binding SARP family transcriptional activator/predicted ATPase